VRFWASLLAAELVYFLQVLEPIPTRAKGNGMALTLKQIAELAGVSRTTASRVLNNHPGVRAEVRERVNQVMAEHGFRPDPVARSLASRRTTGTEAEPVAAPHDIDPPDPA